VVPTPMGVRPVPGVGVVFMVAARGRRPMALVVAETAAQAADAPESVNPVP